MAIKKQGSIPIYWNLYQISCFAIRKRSVYRGDAVCACPVPETVRRKAVVNAKRESIRSVIRRISGPSYFKTWTGWGTTAMIRNSFLRTV